MLAVSTELYRYWRALKAKSNAPERNDVEPGAIRTILADTVMVDFDETRNFPLRIAGSSANALFMRELRGVSFLELWREDDRAAVKATLRRAADEARPYLLTAKAHPPGFAALRIETLVLPLRHGGAAHGRLLGSITSEAAPPWLGLIGAGPIGLVSAQPIDAPDEGAASPGESNAPPASRPRPPATRGSVGAAAIIRS
jgi:hypothetical protein